MILISRSTTRARHRMRCGSRKCRHRFTLKKRPQGDTACPSCGRPAHSVEAQRRRERAKQDRCRCDAYPFPHVRGTLIGCLFHVERLQGLPMTDDQLQAYQATLERDRTAWTFGSERPTDQDYLNAVPF